MKRKSKSGFLSGMSDQNCTVCIASALCVWFLCVLAFLGHNSNSNNGSTSSNSIPSVLPLKNNIPQSNIQSTTTRYQTKQNKIDPILNNDLPSFESISSELNEKGSWNPIYIHSRNVRMPSEQMDYLLEKYWIPPKKENKNANYIANKIKVKKEEEHQTIDNIDFNLKKKKTKKNRMIEQEEEENKNKKPFDNQVKAPSTSVSVVTYPSNWKISCYPSQLNDAKCILNHLKYWQKGVKSIKTKAKITNKYVTFNKDCGGFNNIRQGFEYHVMVAWLTKRTLVIPPDMPWYLIDRGHITRGRVSDEEYTSWPDNEPREQGVSNYDIWFDLDDISLVVPVITTPEFIALESNSLNIPKEYSNDPNIVNKKSRTADGWLVYLKDKAEELHSNLPWGQLGNILYWPSENDVKLKNSGIVNGQWIDNRKAREYTKELESAKIIHFPSCQIGNAANSGDYRYLGQIARSIAFDTVEMDEKYKQILRDHIHLKSQIMEYATLVIKILGAFKYSSYHIRRNELQYKYVWCSGEDSYKHTKMLIGDQETIYIATDETKDDFFDIFKENNRRQVFRWKDFFGENAIFEETKNIQIPAKIHGEVEMVICAMGRMFFGTKESTFSSYIGRLRGYFNAPYTQTLYHHYQLTKDIGESSKISKSKPGKPYAGQIYKIPFPDLWEDIRDLP